MVRSFFVSLSSLIDDESCHNIRCTFSVWIQEVYNVQKCCCIQIEKFCAKNQRTKNSQKNHSRKCRGNVPRSQFKIILAFSRAFHATVVIKVVSHRSFESLPVRLLLNPRAPRESSAVFLQHPRDQTVLPNAVEWSSTASANNRQIRNKADLSTRKETARICSEFLLVRCVVVVLWLAKGITLGGFS